MKTYKEISQAYYNYVRGIGGFWNLKEFNQTNNKFNRGMIRALKRENPHIYLGDRNGNIREYTKGMIYNFSCVFVTTDIKASLDAFDGVDKIYLMWV